MDPFYRIQRLPGYVFTQVQDLKLQARKRGEDIIDLGMGNPDQPTPPHIVDKLIEAAQNGRNHRYSASRGMKSFELDLSKTTLTKSFDVDHIDELQLSGLTVGYQASGGLLQYLTETQPTLAHTHLRRPWVRLLEQEMQLDQATLRNLEILTPSRMIPPSLAESGGFSMIESEIQEDTSGSESQSAYMVFRISD